MGETESSVSEVLGPFVPEYYSTADLKLRWNADVRDIRSWCRKKCISDVDKKDNKWRIPANAMRPLDKKLALEILWRILESPDSVEDMDFSDWGIGSDKFPAYLHGLEKDKSIEPAKQGSYQLTKRGFKLLGREGKKPKFNVIPGFGLSLGPSGISVTASFQLPR